MKSCRSSASHRTPTAPNSDAPAARWSTSSPSQDPTIFTAPAFIIFATACSTRSTPSPGRQARQTASSNSGFTIGGPISRTTRSSLPDIDQHIFHVPTVVQFRRRRHRCWFRRKARNRCIMATTKKATKPWSSAAAAQLNQHGRQLSSRPARQYRLSSKWTSHSARAPSSLGAAQHLALLRIEQCLLRSRQPDHELHAERQRRRRRRHGKQRRSSLTSAISHPARSAICGRNSPAICSSLPAPIPPTARHAHHRRARRIGRSTILPRETREHRLHFAETLSIEAGRHSWKFGGDALLTRIYNYFPSMFGGE